VALYSFLLFEQNAWGRGRLDGEGCWGALGSIHHRQWCTAAVPGEGRSGRQRAPPGFFFCSNRTLQLEGARWEGRPPLRRSSGLRGEWGRRTHSHSRMTPGGGGGKGSRRGSSARAPLSAMAGRIFWICVELPFASLRMKPREWEAIRGKSSSKEVGQARELRQEALPSLWPDF
jgi:hypothetical protein